MGYSSGAMWYEGSQKHRCASVKPGKGGDRVEPLLLRVQPKPRKKREGWR